MKKTSIPKEEWGVHEAHCCTKHGYCKYGDEDCPAAIGLTESIYLCELCIDDEYRYNNFILPKKEEFDKLFLNFNDTEKLKTKVWDFILKNF